MHGPLLFLLLISCAHSMFTKASLTNVTHRHSSLATSAAFDRLPSAFYEFDWTAHASCVLSPLSCPLASLHVSAHRVTPEQVQLRTVCTSLLQSLLTSPKVHAHSQVPRTASILQLGHVSTPQCLPFKLTMAIKYRSLSSTLANPIFHNSHSPPAHSQTVHKLQHVQVGFRSWPNPNDRLQLTSGHSKSSTQRTHLQLLLQL